MRYVENGIGISNRLTYILLTSLILCGVVGGVCLVCSHPELACLREGYMTQGFAVDSSSRTLLRVFVDALSWTGYSLLAIYLCGYSAIGHLMSLALLLLRGVALGVSTGILYMEYGFSGILTFVSMVMLHAVVTSMVLVSSTITSITQSTTIACTIVGHSSEVLNLRRYNVRFLAYTMVVVLSSIVETALTYALYGKFM